MVNASQNIQNNDYCPFNQGFWQWVLQTPLAMAIEDGSRKISYGELGATIGNLSALIQSRASANSSGQPSQFVAVLANHSAEVITGIVAAVVAGKAYLPLDPSQPEARLLAITESLQPGIIIADAANQQRAEALALAAHASGVVMAVLSVELPNGGDARATAPFSPQQIEKHLPAYALTTSGTTGTPKIIVHSRASMMRSTGHYLADLNISQSDKIALALPCSYTPAVFCIFGALYSGATLCVFDIKAGSTTDLIRWIESSQVSLLYSTATLFRRVINTAECVEQLVSLRDIHVVGEPLFTSDVALYQQNFSQHFTVHNGLGTSETACLTRFQINAGTELTGSQVPVGRPYDDVSLRLIDESGADVAEGEPGELVVMCDNFAQGYWGQPKLSAEKFKPVPEQPGSVAYYTGDRAQMLADGNLLYLGRGDTQIKLNGQRIELAEIEATLVVHPSVGNAAVSFNPSLEPAQIIAFAATALTADELRKFLAQRLPHYMVPSHFVCMDALPLNASGKVDRKALSEWQFSPNMAESGAIETPASMLELRVLNCFRDVLKKDLHVNSNFFVEGGDSFKAIELALELENAISAPVNISVLIEAPTPKLLTQAIEGLLYQGHSGVIASLHNKKAVDDAPGKSPKAMICLPGLFGDAFSFRAVVDRFQDDMPIYAMEYPGFEKLGRPMETLEDVVQICFDEIQDVYPVGDIVLVCYSLGGVIGFELCRRLAEAGRPVDSLVLLDCYTPKSIKRKYLLDSVREPLKAIYKKVVGRQDEFNAVFSRHDHLNRILTKAVYKYKPQPQQLTKALLVIATAERSVTVDYQQWWHLIRGEFKTCRIACDHLGLITKQHAPQVCEEMIRHLPESLPEGASPEPA
ncbi:alpha/beta fold hydrolase [Halioxenophilus aromaticivorans]|uniref:Carrier domain-containing protein n=1 Tax=Halioxenophilus aromaticivorans TaxID=1306992 RepID=A0AAV3U4F3_9ALTE